MVKAAGFEPRIFQLWVSNLTALANSFECRYNIQIIVSSAQVHHIISFKFKMALCLHQTNNNNKV